MKTSEWTQKALAALKDAGLIQTGMVNIRHGERVDYWLEVVDPDDEIYELTIKQLPHKGHPLWRDEPRPLSEDDKQSAREAGLNPR